MVCGICGGTEFAFRNVLWPELINEWQLSPAEAEYIARQQGETCSSCGANLRSIALANALRSVLGTTALLKDVPVAPLGRTVSILEINEAGMLSPLLRRFGHYTFGAYPEVDMHALPYPDGAFDVVVHSDTLEHIPNPVHALAECRRVLKPGGALCYTVPIIVGRMTRNRDGLPKSYHGRPGDKLEDYTVHTEFGADAWTYPIEAGFAQIALNTFGYPAAIAIAARTG
jgi:SAM-dependent methyltransferase